MGNWLLLIQRSLAAGALLGLFLLLFTGCAGGPNANRPAAGPENAAWREEPALSAMFDAAGVTGVFVLYDQERKIIRGCNFARAATRYQPASTFKILNSLIAFESGVAKDTREILPYGGGPQPVKAWEQDMTLKDAMAVSNVPLYQGLARRIGLERMNDYVRKARYGNAEIGATVDIFWLKGPLAISALEQLRFISDLTEGRLPFSERSLGLVREIMPRETGPGQGSVVFFKTGRAINARPGIGWVVGWVRLAGREYPFALNMDIHTDADADLRLPLARQALRILGLY